MAVKLPKKYCKFGHPLTMDNIELSMLKYGIRRCKKCNRAYQRDYKRFRRPVRILSTHCKRGHLRKENQRKGKRHSDCLACHRLYEERKRRAAGVPPKRHLTRQEQLEQRRKWEATRKARKLLGFVEVVVPGVVYERAKGICGICKKSVGRDEFEVDHIIPLARGGPHSYSNTQAAHGHCNRVKWAQVDPVNVLA